MKILSALRIICLSVKLGFFGLAKLVKSFLINRKAKIKESVYRDVITYLVKYVSFWRL